MKVNLIQLVLAGGCVILVSVASFTKTNHGWPTSVAAQWFDSYEDLSWENEKTHLDNFAIALQQDSSLLENIIVYAGRRTYANEAKHRALRAKKYLVETRGILATHHLTPCIAAWVAV